MNRFQLIQKDSNCPARTGLLKTPHGDINTPVFMPVGTGGAVKGITPEQLRETGAEIILGNTYHLMLRPGVDAVEKIGGLHKLTAWNKPILTDSGGYQVFSLAALTKIDENGVQFNSHVDGAAVSLTPRSAMEIQNRLGADIIMCLDQCTPYPCDESFLKEAVERTIRWAKMCKESHSNENQMLFGIVQGGINLELRTYCAEKIIEIGFDGYAIGGLSVGEGHENMIKTVRHTAEQLPADLPRYLMGAGTPADIIAAVKSGIDMFDCVMPTRNGRNAYAFTEDGPIRLRNSSHTTDTQPIQNDCRCYCCRNFSRAAIRHFFNIGEMLGPILVSIHNLMFYQNMMRQIKEQIKNGTFSGWADEKIEKYRIFNSKTDMAEQ